MKLGVFVINGRAMRWCAGTIPSSYVLRDPNPRALINPLTPSKWNGYCRWQVDAIGLDKPQSCNTLVEARALAERHA